MKTHKPADLENRIAEIRVKIAVNRGERAESRPLLTREEAKAQLKGWLDYRAQAGQKHLADIAQYLQHPNAAVDLIHPHGLNRDRLEALFCSLCREHLERILTAELDRLIPTNRPTHKQSQAQQARLDVEWQSLEREEERLIRQLEGMGLTPDRRGDADPATVLADDAVLA